MDLLPIAFVDYARRVHEAQVGFTPKRKSFTHHIDKKLGVVAHKHLAQDDPDTDLDLEKMAVDAVALRSGQRMRSLDLSVPHVLQGEPDALRSRRHPDGLGRTAESRVVKR